MLNPPLSLLSYDLIGYLVEHVARLRVSSANKALHNLSLADPAFTEFCQKYIFRTLNFNDGKWGDGSRISMKLEKVKRILDDNPLLAHRVRKIQFSIEYCHQDTWVFQNPSDLRGKDAAYAVAFTSILQLLDNSPMPPHELHLTMQLHPIEDLVGRLSQSFFSHTLTILHLTGFECENVPLPIFLVCPRLKEVHLDEAGAADEDYNNYPDEQCSGRESPALEIFICRKSDTVVRQMISPPPRFHTPVVLWSKLRVLQLSPHEREELAFFQPILDAARNTLEELHLTALNMGSGKCSIFLIYKVKNI
jgi:hypothetical protein